MKKLQISLLLLFCLHTLSAQLLKNADAEKLIKGTELVLLEQKSNSIKHIQFKQSSSAQQIITDGASLLRKSLNLPSEYDYKELKTTKDKLGVYVKYQITNNGIPIEGFTYNIQKKGNSIVSANGYYHVLKTKNNDTSNRLSEENAFKKALMYVNAKKYQWEVNSNAFIPKGELVYLEKETALVLVYKFDIYGAEPVSRQYIYINAESGVVEKTIDRIHIYTNSQGSATTKYQGTKTITTDKLGTTYRLRENQRGNGIETYNMKNGTSYSSAVDFTDADNIWNTTTNQDNAAYDAHYGSEVTYDYFLNNFSRNSIDANGFALKSYVHYSSGFVNAYWDGSAMTYGDGDGVEYTALTSLDIVAHEITHGLTEHTSNLEYSYESGALNESFSDIFGIAIDFYANPTTANFLMGEKIAMNGIPFRSMINPNLYDQPDTYQGAFWYTSSGDNGGVHYNSGVQNYWFYLLCVGGSGVNDIGNNFAVNPIGMDKAAAIAYRTLTVYLTANSQYADARYYSIQSAIDLFGECSSEVINTTNAWHAVGIGLEYSNAVVANFTISQDHFCSIPATAVFTNLSQKGVSYLWNFGDGTTSTLANPSHTYNSIGNYTVSLVTTGTSACNTNDTFTYPNPLVATNSGGPISPSCTPSTVNSIGQYGILNFSFNGINNSSLGAIDGYKDYTCAFSTNITEGVTYNATVSLASSISSLIKIWIDLNNDGLFDGSNELITTIMPVAGTTSFPINIPSPTVYGIPLRLRIASDANAVNNLNTACSNSQYGQFEDYSIIIHQNTLAPSVHFTADKTTAHLGESVTFSDLTENLPTGLKWEFEGGIPATSTLENPVVSYDHEGSFKVKLKSTNSYGADSVTIDSYINIVNSYEMCSDAQSTSLTGILYDSGGASSSYQNSENCSFLIDVQCATSITLSFSSFDTESSYDYLSVYDGSSSAGNLLLRTSGNSLPNSVTAFSGKMYIVFTTDGSVIYPGFQANWSSVVAQNPQSLSDFSISDSNPPIMSEVQFSDLSTNQPVSWQWNFGDGGFSNLQNPKHIFATSGLHSVTLMASSCFGPGVIKTKDIMVQQVPEMILNPTSFNEIMTECNDTLIKTLVIENKGEGSLIWSLAGAMSNLVDNFDPDANYSLWNTIAGGIPTNTCGYFSAPYSLYFNGGTRREAITKPIDCSAGGIFKFHLKIANGTAPCEAADAADGDDIYLSYSIDGGLSWIIIKNFVPGYYNDFTAISEIIPLGGQTQSTIFKISQPYYAGINFDNWSIDNVEIASLNHKFLNISPKSGISSPGQSSQVSVSFISTGLNSGVYTDNIIINSNDPLNLVKLVPCTLDFAGKPKLTLSKTSCDFGSIYTGQSKQDTLVISNNGCDILQINNMTSSLADFRISKTTLSIAPGDTAIVFITFNPKSSSIISGRLNIFSNDIDCVVSLNGVGVSPPIVSALPNALNAVISSCNGSITLPLTVTNSGGSNLTFNIVEKLIVTDDFDPSIDNSFWQSISSGSAVSYCDYYSAPNALYFNGDGARQAITKPINTSAGGSISFYLKIANGIYPCESADFGEDVSLSYSINGGITWVLIKTFYTGFYNSFTSIVETIPVGAKTSATIFKWSQTSFSGSGYDNWAIDNVSITDNSALFYTASPKSGTTSPGASSVIDVTFNSAGLVAGEYDSNFDLVTNDPTSPILTIPIHLKVQTSVSQTSLISGNTTPQAGTPENYSVTAVAGITYNWIADGGSVSGSGNSINVTWFSGGNKSLTVIPSNACESGAAQTLNVVVNVGPLQPSPILGNTAVCLGVEETYSVTNVLYVTYNWEALGGTIIGSGNSISVIWNGSGPKVVKVTPSNFSGIGISRSLNVNVNTPPSKPSVIQGKTTVCSNVSEMYSITNDNGTTYTWTLSGGVVSGVGNSCSVVWNTGGSYVLMVTPSNECENGVSRILNVNVNNTPTTPNVNYDNGLFISDAPTGNQWFFNSEVIPNANTNSYLPLRQGSYSVVVTQNSCSSNFSNSLDFIPTALTLPDNVGEIKIFPNPTSGLVKIQVENYDIRDFDIEIYNNLGSVINISATELDPNSLQLDLTNIPTGVYIIKINKGTESFINKIIKY